MANQKITITIIDDTGESVAPSPEQSEDDSQNKKDKSKDKKGLTPKQHLALSYMEQFGSQVISAAKDALDVRYALEEDYVGQTNLHNAIKAISISTGFAKSIYTGAVSGGMVGGAGGAVAGAIISSALYVGNTIFGAATTLADQTRNMDQQAYGQYFNSVRYGLINDSQGTEN